MKKLLNIALVSACISMLSMANLVEAKCFDLGHIEVKNNSGRNQTFTVEGNGYNKSAYVKNGKDHKFYLNNFQAIKSIKWQTGSFSVPGTVMSMFCPTNRNKSRAWSFLVRKNGQTEFNLK